MAPKAKKSAKKTAVITPDLMKGQRKLGDFFKGPALPASSAAVEKSSASNGASATVKAAAEPPAGKVQEPTSRKRKAPEADIVVVDDEEEDTKKPKSDATPATAEGGAGIPQSAAKVAHRDLSATVGLSSPSLSSPMTGLRFDAPSKPRKTAPLASVAVSQEPDKEEHDGDTADVAMDVAAEDETGCGDEETAAADSTISRPSVNPVTPCRPQQEQDCETVDDDEADEGTDVAVVSPTEMVAASAIESPGLTQPATQSPAKPCQPSAPAKPAPKGSKKQSKPRSRAGGGKGKATKKVVTPSPNLKEGAQDTATPALPPPEPHPRFTHHQERLQRLLQDIERVPLQEEMDYRLGLDDAVAALSGTVSEAEPVAEEAADAMVDVVENEGDAAPTDVFPAILDATLARLIQGSRLTLPELTTSVAASLEELVPSSVKATSPIPSLPVISAKINLIAERKAYGRTTKSMVLPEDTSAEAMWRWEVVPALELLGEGAQDTLKACRAERSSHGRHIKALYKLLDVLTKTPNDAAKTSLEEERVAKFDRAVEAEKQKRLVKEQQRKAKEAKEDEKAARALVKEQEKKAKEEEKRAKEAARAAEKAAKEEAQRKATEKMSVMKFFQKAPPATPSAAAGPAASTGSSAVPGCASADASESWDSQRRESFLGQLDGSVAVEQLRSAVVTGVGSGSKRCASESVTEKKRPRKRVKLTVMAPVPVTEMIYGGSALVAEKEVEVGGVMKLLFFKEDERPPYKGTWSKRSALVTGRRPFGQDPRMNYDYDSEAEWEEGDVGEELKSDEEEEKDPDDGLDYEDGFLRHDGEWSENELSDRDDDDDKGPRRSGGEGGVGQGRVTWQGLCLSPAMMETLLTVTDEEKPPTLPDATAAENATIQALWKYRWVAIGAMPIKLQPVESPPAPIVSTSAAAVVESVEAAAAEGEIKKKPKGKPKKSVLSNDLLPALVQFVDGNKTASRDQLVSDFVAQHEGCSKNCVSLRIKEIATKERSAAVGGGIRWSVRAEIKREVENPSTPAAVVEEAHEDPVVESTDNSDTPSSPAAKGDGGSAIKLVPGQKSLDGFVSRVSKTPSTTSTPAKGADGASSSTGDSTPAVNGEHTPAGAMGEAKFHGPFSDGGWLEYKETAPSPPVSTTQLVAGEESG